MAATCNLETVLKGGILKYVDRTKFEIVITRFNEPLLWTEGIEHLCTVYNKGDADSFHFHKEANVVSVPNYGVGTETILRHIIGRYDSLADVTFFSQATLCDRVDQPLYPLKDYYLKCSDSGLFGYKDRLIEPADARFQWRISSPSCKSVGDLDFGKWRQQSFVMIPYAPTKRPGESWVKGDWISVGRDRIRRRPLAYYQALYDACQFNRGILVEECWFLERTFYSIFE